MPLNQSVKRVHLNFLYPFPSFHVILDLTAKSEAGPLSIFLDLTVGKSILSWRSLRLFTPLYI